MYTTYSDYGFIRGYGFVFRAQHVGIIRGLIFSEVHIIGDSGLGFGVQDIGCRVLSFRL